jgi:L,D-transpeptidase catalytic domain
MPPGSRSRRTALGLGLAALVYAACARAPTPAPPPGPPAPPTAAPTAPAGPPPSPCVTILWMEVHKSARQLEAHCEGGGRLLLTVALGREPGAKRSRGDQRTPEGLYHVAGPAKPSRFHRFLPIDYPSAEDADRARREGRLSERDHARILSAHARDAPPPVDTPLGGGLGFHGEGERWRGDSAHLDWTYGCLAVRDAEIDFLAAHAPPGTPVRILP